MGNAELRALLRDGNLDALALGCERALAEERYDQLRLLRQRLLSLHPAPQPLPVVLANADVLIGCQQPEAALTVLERISPAAGAERVQWLLMEWRAANAALDHRRAAFALERLTASRPERLDQLLLPVARRPDGSVVSRPAIDLLAEHQRARGFPGAAADLLLASREPGAAGAERRLEAVRALAQLPAQEREALLESALDQAAAAGAWGLVAELLDAQVALPSERARQRRLRLSPRIDDTYGEWLLRRQDPLPSARLRELERQLRAPVPLPDDRPSPPEPALVPKAPHPGSSPDASGSGRPCAAADLQDPDPGGFGRCAAPAARRRLLLDPTRPFAHSPMTAFSLGSLLYEGKAKRVFATDQPDRVAVEFKDDATAFNAQKRASLAGKGACNCLISALIFEVLERRGIATHYLGLAEERWMVVRPVQVVPLEVVVRNIAAGSLCRQLPITEGTALEPPLLDLYYKDDGLGDPFLSEARLERLGVVNPDQRQAIGEMALAVNLGLRDLFGSVDLELVDFKIELGFASDGSLLLADEISPDTCRLWDRRQSDSSDRILDKDRFRQDLGGVMEAYGEVLKRVQGVCPEPRVYG
jgi:phosphoribosylaminoimidazole-succinocarboxamide synthase